MKKDLDPKISFRQNCPRCTRPFSYCYCTQIKKIDSKIKFVILIHPIEVRRKIATGRMAHLCLSNSILIRGEDFTHNSQVNEILKNPRHHCLLLYPGKNSINISTDDLSEKIPSSKKELVIFVVDGTWSTAKKTIRLSENLKKIPSICFTPSSPSQFRIRKQPAPHCYSTIEAIYFILKLLEGKKQKVKNYNTLMTVFKNMVEQQIKHMKE